MPYGPFIAAGTIVSVLFGDELILWYLIILIIKNAIRQLQGRHLFWLLQF